MLLQLLLLRFRLLLRFALGFGGFGFGGCLCSALGLGCRLGSCFGGRGVCSRVGCCRQRLSGSLLLVEQRRQPIGEVPRKCLDQVGQLAERSDQCAGELGEQYVPRRQFCKGVDVGGRDDPFADHASLDDQIRVVAGEVPQRLRDRTHVASHERDGGRTAQQLVHRRLRSVGDSDLDEGVLVDLVVATRRGESLAKLGQLGDGEAAVLGQQCPIRLRKAVAYLVDDGDLLSPRIVHGSSAEQVARIRAVDAIRRRRAKPVGSTRNASSGGPTLDPFGAGRTAHRSSTAVLVLRKRKTLAQSVWTDQTRPKRPPPQAVAASSSVVLRARSGSTWTPGPIVEEMVTALT